MRLTERKLIDRDLQHIRCIHVLDQLDAAALYGDSPNPQLLNQLQHSLDTMQRTQAEKAESERLMCAIEQGFAYCSRTNRTYLKRLRAHLERINSSVEQ